MRKLLCVSAVVSAILLLQLSAIGQPFSLLKDVNYGTLGGGPQYFAEMNGSVYFTVMDSRDHGLWKTDGTAAGTVRLKDLIQPRELTVVNGTLFFVASLGGNTNESLWKSDGTETGTVQVKDISLGSWDIGNPRANLTNVNGTLFFSGDDGIYGRELWKSDGTEAGTVMVKDLWPGPDRSPLPNMVNVNGTLFFGINGSAFTSAIQGLWKSDGTEAGTQRISTVIPDNLTSFNGMAVFAGDVGKPTQGFWKSDGTAAGTVQVSGTVPGPMSIQNGNLIFASGSSIWTSDATAAGTTAIFSTVPNQILIQSATFSNNTYFIARSNPGNIYELWKSNGTAAGTSKIKDISNLGSPSLLTALSNGTVLFLNYSAAEGIELWKSDGTESGTVLIKDIRIGTESSQPKNFFANGNTAYFLADDGLNGKEFWKTDGTASGTIMAKDIYSPTLGSNARNFINFNNTLFFAAADLVPNGVNGPIGDELRKSDGTTTGTELIKNIGPLGTAGDPKNMTVFNGFLYFSANDAAGYEIWKSDGTTINANTQKVKEILPGSLSADPSWLTVTPNAIFFSATNGTSLNGNELWKTDGTQAGTVLVKDINPGGAANSDPSDLVNVNGIIYFAANDGVNGRELWKSDGTDAGTTMIKNIHSAAGSNPSKLINVNGIVYLTADDGANGAELWRTDGTDAGTYMVKDINTTGSSDPASLTILNGIIYFSAADGSGGRELWKTDGTNTGTVLVKDINTLPGNGSDPLSLKVLNGLVYFSADNGIAGRELWRSDGTDAGTILMMDINTGGSSNPTVLTNVGLKLFFAANDGTHGNEIWATDGISVGMIQDIEPGAGSSDPTEFIEISGKIYASVFNSLYGREVWVGTATLNSPLPLTLLEFKGSLVNDNGVLQWKTDNELNTKSFAIERSTDGRNYSSVGHVTAANASGVHTYDYTDANIKSLGASIVYYRLRQVDADNKFTYSRIVALSIDNKNSFAMLYPNPVRSEINLTITLAKKERLNWQLIDNNGRIIKNGSYNLSAGSTAVSIDVSTIGSGHYIMQLKGESLQQTIKIIKQ